MNVQPYPLCNSISCKCQNLKNFKQNPEGIMVSFEFKGMFFYRPQRSCCKVMFLRLSVSNSVHRGRGCLADTPPRQTLPGLEIPLGRSPWAYTLWPESPLGSHPPAYPPVDYPPRDTPFQTPPPPPHHGRQASYRNVFLFSCLIRFTSFLNFPSHWIITRVFPNER